MSGEPWINRSSFQMKWLFTYYFFLRLAWFFILGSTMSHHTQSTLRRGLSHPKPQNQQQQHYQNLHATEHELTNENDPPPPPAPSGGIGSNSSTPRGSLEHLPPPPPHLLHSDEEVDSGASSNGGMLKGISVAESVKALQQRGHTPCSPKSLRRAHSVSSTSPFQRQLGVSMSGPTASKGSHQHLPQQQQQPQQEQGRKQQI